MMAALIVGNKCLVKVDSKVSIVIEQFIRLLIECGMPAEDVDLFHADGENTEKLITMTPEIRMIQFTGSNAVAEHLLQLTKGKCKIEHGGFDWKILGPGVINLDYVCW